MDVEVLIYFVCSTYGSTNFLFEIFALLICCNRLHDSPRTSSWSHYHDPNLSAGFDANIFLITLTQWSIDKLKNSSEFCEVTGHRCFWIRRDLSGSKNFFYSKWGFILDSNNFVCRLIYVITSSFSSPCNKLIMGDYEFSFRKRKLIKINFRLILLFIFSLFGLLKHHSRWWRTHVMGLKGFIFIDVPTDIHIHLL